MKATQLRELLKTKYNREPGAMLKSAMVTLLQNLDAEAAAANGEESVAPEVVEEPVKKVEEKPKAKATGKKTAKAAAAVETPVVAEKPAAKATAKATAKAAASKASVAKEEAKPVVAEVKETKPAVASSSASPAAVDLSSNPLSAARLAARANRFGTSDDRDKLAARAEKFGLDYQLPKTPMERRAERAAAEEAKKAKQAADLKAFNERAARFGLPLKIDQAAENEKKRQRAERFKSNEAGTKKPKISE